MADKTLTVNGQPFTINRDRKAEVSQLSVNGQAFHIDRTAPVIESDPVGNSRPLLSKLVGGAAVAYSLRDLNSKQGDTDVVNVRRSTDNEEKIFQAKDVDKISDWVSGKQDADLPASVNYERAVKVTISHSLIDSGNTKTLTMFVGASNNNNTHENGFLRYHGYIGSTVYKLYNSPSAVNWRFRLESSPSTDYAVSSNNAIPGNVTDVPSWENGDDGGTLNSFSIVAASPASVAYSLRKVKADYANDAVRIRRSSDDVEVNVAFDSEGKVSSSSPITDGGTELTPNPDADLGSTSATNLNGFLNETLSDRFSTVDYPSGIGSDFRKWSTLTATSNSFVATTGTFADNTARYNYVLPAVLTAAESASTTFRFSGTVNYTASGGTGFNIKQGSNATASSTHDFANLTSTGVGTISSDTFKFSNGDSGDFSFEFTGNGTNDFRSIVFLQTIVSSGSSSMSLTNLKFEIIKHGATVHTWYDQAGSNNAVQNSAGSQPKIAENGALLTDGIQFDGTDDALNFTDMTLTNASIFSVLNIDSSEDKQIILGGSDSTASATMIPMMDNDSTSSQVYKNTTVGGAEQGSSQFKNSASRTLSDRDDAFDLLALNKKILFTMLDVDVAEAKVLDGISQTPSDATTWGLKGTMEELIIYNSAQSSHRHKIENNINNYYGLYNDANDLNTGFVKGGNAVTTSNSVNGFTGRGDKGAGVNTAVAGVQLKQVGREDEIIYVGFNATLGSATPTVSLRRNAIGGDLASDAPSSGEPSVINGFNTFALVSDVSDAEFITFHDSTENEFTISDFRVSRVNREGFVETWYDQSGNLRDAIQVSETKQPTIVSHGSVVKLNSKPAITFDGNDNFLEVDGTDSAVPYSFSPSGDMGMFIVSKQSVGNVIDSRDAGGDGVFLQQASANTTRFRYNASSNNIDVTATRDVRHLSVLTLDGTTLSASVDGGTATNKTVTAGVSTTKNLVLGKAFSGNNSNFVNGEIQEAIFYERKQTHNIPAIKANINNQYQIYS